MNQRIGWTNYDLIRRTTTLLLRLAYRRLLNVQNNW
ncbi:hypothetical protein V6Z12_D07G245700 [Gossypium hirsutum]